MRHEVEKRIREYDEDVVVLSQDEVERFTRLLKDVMKYSEVNGKFPWMQTDGYEAADVAFTFRARIHKGKDVVPETLTDMSLSIIINGYTLTNEDVKVCKC